jgi:hypothetical protein
VACANGHLEVAQDLLLRGAVRIIEDKVRPLLVGWQYVDAFLMCHDVVCLCMVVAGVEWIYSYLLLFRWNI